MKTFRLKKLGFALVLSSACMVAVSTSAQTDNPKEKAGNRPESAPGERPAFRGPMARGAVQGLERLMSVLTDEQRASLREAMDSEREKTRDLEEKARDARKDLFEESLAGKFNEERVREKANALGKVEAEMILLRARAFSKMRPPLSAEQIQTLKNNAQGRPDEPAQSPRRRRDVPRDENGLPLKKN